MNKESKALKKLESLCTSQGYIHALAALCFRDNFYAYQDELTISKVAENFSMHALIRQEISLLTAMMLKNPVDGTFPGESIIETYMDATDQLLHELHVAINSFDFAEHIKNDGITDNPFTKGEVLRETIFYSGETAYDFQYLDFSKQKYQRDDEWLLANKGFTIKDAVIIAKSISSLHTERALIAGNLPDDIRKKGISYLPIFMFSIDDIHSDTGIDNYTIKNFIHSFSISGIIKEKFRSASDLNPVNIYPIIQIDEKNYVLFQLYSLAESLYESPFYWFLEDTSYKPIAETNRGAFTEDFCFKILCSIFGEQNVFKNVEIYDSKQRVGEIDVLVIFAGRALVLQAKSKRLTLLARKGDDKQIRGDFEKTIQAAYDQGLLCCKNIFNDSLRFVVDGKKQIAIGEIKNVYIFCVISDNYPSLSFQARQFLKYETSDNISWPLVFDIFTLDAICEMLSSPLLFLSYIDRRARFSDKIIASSELIILSYHLRQNLWINEGNTLIHLHEDVSAAIDVAMCSRRKGADGKKNPDGILTRYHETTLGGILKQIEAKPNKEIIDFGLFVLEFSEETFMDVSVKLEKIISLARADGNNHDLSVIINENNSGMTIHCNSLPQPVAQVGLQKHCEMRKYRCRAAKWFGVCLSPTDLSLRFGLTFDYSWQQDSRKDAAVQSLPLPPQMSKKIGRNELCPCGSGKKYKKCCLVKKDN